MTPRATESKGNEAARECRQVIEEAYASRRRRNPKYSLRALARDLGISASMLSEILAGKRGLSKAGATKIARRLGLTPGEAFRFRDLAIAAHARSAVRRDEALHRATLHRKIAYLERSESGGPGQVDWQALRTALARRSASSRDSRALIGHTTASELLASLHTDALARALDAVTARRDGDSEFETAVFLMSAGDLPKAREKLREFLHLFVAEFADGKEPAHVYTVTVHLVPVADPRKP